MSDLQNLTPANTYKGLLQVGDYTNGVDSTVRSVLDGEGTASALAISTTKVGIGTTSPTQELEVNGDIVSTTLTASGAVTAGSVSTSGAVGAGSIDVGGNVVADEYALDQVGSSSSAVAIHAPVTNELAIRTNTAERVRVDSSGNVGIGTTSPQGLLTIKSPSANNAFFQARNTSDNIIGSISETLNGSGLITARDSSGNENVYLSADSTQDSYIQNSNLGIGTTSPAVPLDVRGDVRLDSSGSTDRSIYFRNQDPASTVGGSIKSDYYLSLWAGNGGGIPIQIVTIADSGNVGINTVNPSAPLEVASTTGGVIMPRMTTTQMNAISSPTDGEMIYNTTANKFYGRANGSWVALH